MEKSLIDGGGAGGPPLGGVGDVGVGGGVGGVGGVGGGVGKGVPHATAGLSLAVVTSGLKGFQDRAPSVVTSRHW
jgi:hypothetical protein